MNDEIIDGMPVLYLTIDDLNKDGVDTISFVANPATKTDWYTFSEEYHFINHEKRIVTAPVMLAEVPIRRAGHFVKFSAETIFQMRNKYFMENKIHRVNENHDSDKMVEGVYMVESFILDDRIDMSLYPNLTKGTWMASFYIQDENYWNDVIKAGKFSGFSLEGHFSPQKPKNTMNLLERLKSLFKEHDVEKEKYEDLKTADDRIIRIYSLENGGRKVMEISENGEVDITENNLTLEDGTVLEVVNSIITNVIPLEAGMYPKRKKEKEDMENEEKFSVEEFMEMLNCRCTGGERLQIRKFETEDGKFEFSIEKEVCEETETETNMEQGEESETIEEEIETIVETNSTEVAFSEIMEKLNSLSNEIQTIKNDNETLKSRVQKFAAEPSDIQTETTPKLKAMSREDKLKFFAQR